jgi:hypothetical protein
VYLRGSRLGPAAIEIAVRHSSATISRRVSLSEISFAAATPVFHPSTWRDRKPQGVHLLAFHNTNKDVPYQQQPFFDGRQSFAVEDIRVDTQLLGQATIASQFLDKRANRTSELSTRARIASSLVQIYTLGLRSFFVLEKLHKN